MKIDIFYASLSVLIAPVLECGHGVIAGERLLLLMRRRIQS